MRILLPHKIRYNKQDLQFIKTQKNNIATHNLFNEICHQNS